MLFRSRPVVLLAAGAAEPGELLCASPSSLRGPSHAQWTPLGAARHYAGQMAVVAGQQTAFKRAFKMHYLQKLRYNHNMAVSGKNQFSQGDIVLICDLSSAQGQSPHPVVGRIKSFVDPLNAQAVVAYGAGRTVDRPLHLLVKLVGAEEQVPEEGLLFDPFIKEDIAQAEEQDGGHLQDGDHGQLLDGQLGRAAQAGLERGPGLPPGDGGRAAGEREDDIPVAVPVQQDGQLAHPGQAELGHGHAGITGKSGIAVIAGDIGVADNSEIANSDKEEKEVNEEKEEEKEEEKVKEEEEGEKEIGRAHV